MIRWIFTIAITLALMRFACPLLLAQQADRPLTNADVIRMVKDGIPESSILESIRSRPGAFDFLTPGSPPCFRHAGKVVPMK
jgi:hypothetical protein